MPNSLVIEKNDVMCYWVFDPQHFSAYPKCLNLEGKFPFRKEEGYTLSVNSKNLCDKYPLQIHNLGKPEERIRTTRSGENQIYEGFIGGKVEKIEDIGTQDQHYLKVKHDPLPTNDIHCNIILEFPGDKPIKQRRAWIRKELIACFGDETIKP